MSTELVERMATVLLLLGKLHAHAISQFTKGKEIDVNSKRFVDLQKRLKDEYSQMNWLIAQFSKVD